MRKYDTQFKLRVVKYVLEENHGVKVANKAFGLHSHGDIVKWVNKYKLHGINGLNPNNFGYDSNFKKNVVEYMKEKHLSLTQTAIHFNLADARTVSRWLEEYDQGKLDGRNKTMPKNRKTIKKSENIDTQKLLEENEYLRMENAYLKKLSALVQERIERDNKKK